MAGFLDSIKDIFFKPNTPQASDVEVLKLYISEMFLKYDKRNTRQGERIMEILKEIQDAQAASILAAEAERLEVLAKIDAAAAENAAQAVRIIELIAQIEVGGISAADLQGLLDQANVVTAKIQSIYVAPAVEVPAEPV
jgi:hypothetical protein